jgi:hypothetical protein
MLRFVGKPGQSSVQILGGGETGKFEALKPRSELAKTNASLKRLDATSLISVAQRQH